MLLKSPMDARLCPQKHLPSCAAYPPETEDVRRFADLSNSPPKSPEFKKLPERIMRNTRFPLT